MKVTQTQTLLAFGPQSLSFTNQALRNLRHEVDSSSYRDWIHEAIAGLPGFLTALSNSLPELLEVLPSQEHLHNLQRLLREGTDIDGELNLPNTILTPLVVITHLTEYGRYLSAEKPTNGSTKATGFCTGLLSTFAVASSQTPQDLAKFGGVAIRLAMLIGALVDADENRQELLGNGRSRSFGIAWSSEEQEKMLHETLSRWQPDVYLSVRYDRARATLTSSGHGAVAIANEMREAGLTAAEVKLRGRFHDPADARRIFVDALLSLCDRTPDLQFATSPVMPLAYANPDKESLHRLAVKSMLVQHCDWYSTFLAALPADRPVPRVVSFGSEKCIPSTLAKRLSQAQQTKHDEPQYFSSLNQDKMIAVVGMSIKTAGADDVDEFALMLRTGESQHQAIKSGDINFNTPWREDTGSRTWYSNFIKDRNQFDHAFFRMSPREAAAMDPQHRHFLQAAYQAVEQSGYFSEAGLDDTKLPGGSIGVFAGIATTDYDQHISCYDPNAYTATGNLRAFLAGRVAHHFGWTGPALTLDTACSSSAVAIHLACQSILSGECSAALAGGVAVMSSPFWFQNLGAASFLSPTGQCKPFDEAGDGYCRAEGIGCVMLKRLDDALANNDQILGTIAASAVQQNQNCTPIVVPNKPSLAPLFKQVVARSGINSADINLVEAHGTGTAVGDPAEYASIAHGLDVAARTSPLYLGSVKGHIGHTEAAAGVLSLIKVLMMMNDSFIPPQASHTRLSPRISEPTDKMQVSKALRPWDAPRKAALVNSYGASGSNTSMVVLQAPNRSPSSTHQSSNADGLALPFWISGMDDSDIAGYCMRLNEYIRSRPTVQLEDISFNLSRQLNRSLPRQLTFSCRTMSELSTMLARGSSAESQSQAVPSERPVILCFGGQVSTFVGLNRTVYESVGLLRHYLDQCDAVIQNMGLQSIFPDIFCTTPISDTVKLQCMLFALQWSCARCWLDSGVSRRIAAVVGHSFGELTALSIAGVLSLEDTIKLVAGRARLIRDNWGSDRGAMMAVEGEESIIHELLEQAAQETPTSHPASIACYNGPRSFTLAGSVSAIQGVKEILVDRYPFIRHKQLNVTNAFHCSLADSIVKSLIELGEELTWNAPTLHIEHASPHPSTGAKPSSTFPADHLRKPVHFYHAIERLARAYPSSIWLEAGSNSTITTMAGRAIRPAGTVEQPRPQHHFQALNITHGGRGSDSLTETTMALWRQGLRVSFWQHKMDQYAHLVLPPRQFANTRHGHDIILPKSGQTALAEPKEQTPEGLWTFVAFEDNDETRPRFRINTESEKYISMVEGHVMASTAAICPAGLEVDMAIEALFSLYPEWKEKQYQPMLENMVNSSPVCLDPSRTFWLNLSATDESRKLWDWNITSTHKGSTSTILHVKASLHFRAPDNASYRAEFARLERLVSHQHCTDILSMAGAIPDREDEVQVLQGRNVYEAFSDVISYTDQYRSLRRLVGHRNESAGCVIRQRSEDTWLDVPLSECFMQTGGIFISTMTDRSPSDVFIATGCELWMRSPRPKDTGDKGPKVWHVLARHTRVSDKKYLTDVFVFDSRSGALTEVIMGTEFSRLPKVFMRKILSDFVPAKSSESETESVKNVSSIRPSVALPLDKPRPKMQQPDISTQIKQLLSSVSGIDPGKISSEAELADLGVDSLMAMELAREIEGLFKFSPDHNDLMEATTVEKLTNYISSSCPSSSIQPASSDDVDSLSTSDETESSTLNPSTPTDISSASNDDPYIRNGGDIPESALTKTKTVLHSENPAAGREELAEGYIASYTAGFLPPVPAPSANSNSQKTRDIVVVITGATGSLGSHLVASSARNPTVREVICLNRSSNVPAATRQKEALASRRLELTEAESAKLRVLSGNSSEPHLGLKPDDYTYLVNNASHIIHNGWPMSLRRPIQTFVPQFQALRNLIDLAREIACNDPHSTRKVGFQFVSSISVVGAASQQRVLEQRVDLGTSLPLGYPEAKWVCEWMLEKTLHKYPDHFRVMTVRPGQISGSRSTGVWPHNEHMPLLIKSARKLNAWPDLGGPLHWIPVDVAALTMVDLLLPKLQRKKKGKREPDAFPVYHIDNPRGQPWAEMTSTISSALGIPSSRVIPYQDFLNLLRSSPLDRDRDIPAAKLMDFFQNDFLHMACGGVVLDTTLSQQHSEALAKQGSVSAEEVQRYIERWKEIGFLSV